jgi:hypothetical protein
MDLTGKFGSVTWPVVMYAGWYDIFLTGNLMVSGHLPFASSARGRAYLVQSHKMVAHSCLGGVIGGWFPQAFRGFQHESDRSVRGKHRLFIDPLGHCQVPLTTQQPPPSPILKPLTDRLRAVGLSKNRHHV